MIEKRLIPRVIGHILRMKNETNMMRGIANLGKLREMAEETAKGFEEDYSYLKFNN
jgi:hypothetical protein